MLPRWHLRGLREAHLAVHLPDVQAAHHAGASATPRRMSDTGDGCAPCFPTHCTADHVFSCTQASLFRPPFLTPCPALSHPADRHSATLWPMRTMAVVCPLSRPAALSLVPSPASGCSAARFTPSRPVPSHSLILIRRRYFSSVSISRDNPHGKAARPHRLVSCWSTRPGSPWKGSAIRR